MKDILLLLEVIKSSLNDGCSNCSCKSDSSQIDSVESVEMELRSFREEVSENVTSLAKSQCEIISDLNRHVNDLSSIVESFNRRIESNTDDVQGLQLRMNDVEDFTYIIPIQKNEPIVRKVFKAAKDFLSAHRIRLLLGFVSCIVSGTVIAGLLLLLQGNI